MQMHHRFILARARVLSPHVSLHIHKHTCIYIRATYLAHDPSARLTTKIVLFQWNAVSREQLSQSSGFQIYIHVNIKKKNIIFL